MLEYFNNIPADLRNYKQWICWRSETQTKVINGVSENRLTKIPYNVQTAEKASTTNPADWVTYDHAIEVFKQGHYTGIGFVLTSADPFIFIDFDEPKDYLPREEKAEILQRQQKIYDEFDTYSEISPSGKGLHLICKAPNLDSGARRGSIEMYSSGRYMTMTGKVYGDKNVINQRNELVSILHGEMKKDLSAGTYRGSIEQPNTDEEVYNMVVGAENGAKALDLINGNWIDYYSSQSEADFALINIISYYTDNVAQIMRCFRLTALGQRPKAQRNDYIMNMVKYSFDKKLPPVDTKALQSQLAAAIELARVTMSASHTSPGNEALSVIDNSDPQFPIVDIKAEPHPAPLVTSANPYDTWPMGLTGEIAKFIYHSSPKPIMEIAIAGALGLMAGIAGRAYNISGTGLNQYIMLLAGTGTGKESMASGTSRLASSIEKNCPTINDYLGPSNFASGSGLLQELTRKHSIFSIIGEFGIRLSKMESAKAAAYDQELKAELLDLYNKSGHGDVKRSKAYSDKKNNIPTIKSPALTFVGESVPENFYNNISAKSVLEGFVPRFMIIEYKGDVPPFNYARLSTPSDLLRNKLMELVATCSHLNGQNQVFNVPATETAETHLNEFAEECRHKLNNKTEGAGKELWNRAHLKLLKLSALLAVGDNCKNPIINAYHVRHAKAMILYNIVNISGRFDRGEIGIDDVEANQERDFKKTVMQYVMKDSKEFEGITINADMWDANIIPLKAFAKVKRRVSFKDSAYGNTRSLDRVISTFIEMGALQEVPRSEIRSKYGYSGRSFMISDPYIFGISRYGG